MHNLSNRTKMLLSTTLAVGLIVSSVTACSPRGKEEATPDRKTQSQQSLQQGNGAAKNVSDQDDQEGNFNDEPYTDESGKGKEENRSVADNQPNTSSNDDNKETSDVKQEPSDTDQQPNASLDGQNAEDKTLTQEQKDFYISQYISMNPFTFQSWSDPETIESFRFGTFYGQNAFNNPKYSPEQYAIEDTPNYEIPQNIFEEFIQLYFNVSSDYLRTSRFYDSEKEIYTGFLAGGGIPVEYNVESAQNNGSIEEITYIATDENGATKITIGIDKSGDHFKFVYVKR